MIVGVEVRFGDELQDYLTVRLPAPNRHCHCYEYFVKTFGKPFDQFGLKSMGESEGFYTDKGVYLTREQAWNHVKRCGQKLTDSAGKRGPLFSEDVW